MLLCPFVKPRTAAQPSPCPWQAALEESLDDALLDHFDLIRVSSSHSSHVISLDPSAAPGSSWGRIATGRAARSRQALSTPSPCPRALALTSIHYPDPTNPSNSCSLLSVRSCRLHRAHHGFMKDPS